MKYKVVFQDGSSIFVSAASDSEEDLNAAIADELTIQGMDPEYANLVDEAYPQ